MRVVLAIIFLTGFLILQMGIQDASIFPFVPSLVLAYLCVLLLYLRHEEVLWLALGSGLVIDFLSGTLDGTFMIAIPTAVAAAFYLGQSFFTERLGVFLLPFYAVSATAILHLAALLVLWALSLLGWVESVPGQYLLLKAMPVVVILNLLSLIPAYYAFALQDKLQKKFWPKHELL